ncbi:hypothetical protein KP509_02G103700 [Ceratopteris richardii]|uniref:Uncharacterized protein n=1 Tax=Ceratopteris richardii TaxID=49495 RepID=A0A8T2VG99_CERRI|nr:hypothetical protein KP509_02G103700 [Ceratopteris richardii]
MEEGEISHSWEAKGRVPDNLSSGHPTETLPVAVKQDILISDCFGGHVEEDKEVDCVGKGEYEHDADADDEGEENAPKSSYESENPLEASKEASCSDFFSNSSCIND